MIHKIIVHGCRGNLIQEAVKETYETQEDFTNRLVELSSTGYRLEVYGPVAHAWRDAE